MWTDWAIYFTLGNFSKPGATINFPKSHTVLGNFCKGAKIFHDFLVKSFSGNCYRHLATFLLVTLRVAEDLVVPVHVVVVVSDVRSDDVGHRAARMVPASDRHPHLWYGRLRRVFDSSHRPPLHFNKDEKRNTPLNKAFHSGKEDFEWCNQGDQMARLLFQYLAIYNIKNLPDSSFNLPKCVKIFDKYLWTL